MVAVTALLLFGILQVSQLLAAREVLAHAAARGARARTVGFNHWMVEKVVDVATIPNAGRMEVPDYENVNQTLRDRVATTTPGATWDYAVRTTPSSAQAGLERARIPEYLGAENTARARFILDYKDWDTIDFWDSRIAPPDDDPEAHSIIHVHVDQDYPLWAPMHRAFWAADECELAGDAYIETHYPLYLVDMNW